MFCELGGEFVDTYNEDIRKLGKELGVEMQNLTTEGGDELYFFKGVFHMPNDMIDPKKKTGAFVPIAKQIAKDAGKLTDKHDNWTAYARKLNALQNKIDMKQGFAHVARRQRRRDHAGLRCSGGAQTQSFDTVIQAAAGQRSRRSESQCEQAEMHP